MKEGRRNSYAAQNKKKERDRERQTGRVKRGRRSAKSKAWNGRANDHAREEEKKQKKKGEEREEPCGPAGRST